MKFRKINIKKLFLLGTTGIVIINTGCARKTLVEDSDSLESLVEETAFNKDYIETETQYYDTTDAKTTFFDSEPYVIDLSQEDGYFEYTATEFIIEKNESTQPITSTSCYDETLTASTFDSNKENDILNYLEQVDDKINDATWNLTVDLKNDFDTIFDFLFNNGKIYDYTLEQLSDEGKAKAISIFIDIDEKIDSKFPEYKETIKEKYGDIKSFLSEKITSLKGNIIEYLGEDRCEYILNYKDSLVDSVLENGSSAKEKVKNWLDSQKQNED